METIKSISVELLPNEISIIREYMVNHFVTVRLGMQEAFECMKIIDKLGRLIGMDSFKYGYGRYIDASFETGVKEYKGP